MQRIRISESQLLLLSQRARGGAASLSGWLHKRSQDCGRWQLRYFALFQNLLFHYDTDRSDRPSGVALLEGSYCDKYLSAKFSDKQGHMHCFSIFYRKEGLRQYDLRAETEAECEAWVEAITNASYSKLLESKEELEQKHLHLLHILDSERQSKWNYVQQTDELTSEVAKLRREIRELKEAKTQLTAGRDDPEGREELNKIKKVQSFFRGWLCRRRWKQIVEEYIRSEHAEHMRKRNGIVFGLVECEEEYVRQIGTLVTCFLRPCRMAASAKKPIVTHEDVNSIFLNAEALLFLHQIFLQGLNSKMDNWPTLQLGDLFDLLLPMLGIYQEYVRNHHFSLQVLAEYKQKQEFAALLKRYEEKPACEGRSLDDFLTYPMHQIPRYIVTLHELLAHTPHDHVDRQQLEFAKSKLEDLSNVMHDEVSETENIRKNLAIERMIVEGCDILLDVNQIFVRQGSLTQVLGPEKSKNYRTRLGSFSSTFKDSKKEAMRQVFLFTNHIILTTRASSGRLHLVKNHGKIPLSDCTLAEDSSDFFFFDDEDANPQGNLLSVEQKVENRADYAGCDFRLVLDTKSGPALVITLVACSVQEKAAWCSDINQCIEQIHYSDLLNSTLAETSSVSMPHTIRSDPKLFKDDVDIKFSRTLNSCKVPQIRHASVDRLLDRLTDLRFLSIDFLNTFLLTYRIFTNPSTVISAMKRVLSNPESGNLDPRPSICVENSLEEGGGGEDSSQRLLLARPQLDKARRISTGMMRLESAADTGGRQAAGPHRTGSLDASACERLVSKRPHFDASVSQPPAGAYGEEDSPNILRELSDLTERRQIMLAAAAAADTQQLAPIASCEIVAEEERQQRRHMIDRKVRIAGVTESEVTDASPPLLSTDAPPPTPQRLSPLPMCRPASPRMQRPSQLEAAGVAQVCSQVCSPVCSQEAVAQRQRPQQLSVSSPRPQPRRATSPTVPATRLQAASPISHSASSPTVNQPPLPGNQRHLPAAAAAAGGGGGNFDRMPRGSVASWCGGKRPSCAESFAEFSNSQRGSIARTDADSPPCRPRLGAVVTSSRASRRRSSNTAAALAFAAATAGAGSVPKATPSKSAGPSADPCVLEKRLSIICTAATMRVLNVVRHWVYKFGEDVESDRQLRSDMQDLLEDLVCNQSLFPPDHKAALQILLRLRAESLTEPLPDIRRLLTPAQLPSAETFDTLSALDIAEQITFVDHQIFRAVRSNELLLQAWMKRSKTDRSGSVNVVSQRFNEVSSLVISEIVTRTDIGDRVACLEKWAAIADICRCLHNYNGVLEICAAFVNSSVFRLKKTWDRVPKPTRQMVDRLQQLVSSDGRFKNMRAALHACDPPCIPYLGMYLTDLSFIEEGTSNRTEEGLINFCKMRMIAHVIREIQQYQHTPYRIHLNQKVCDYLLDSSRWLSEEQAYQASLRLEPRLSVCPETAQAKMRTA